MQGQINRGSALGDQIYELSKRKDVNVIVDIGTWNGMGSTKCIKDGVIGTNKEVYSLECNKIRHEEAKINLMILPPNFKLIHGTIVTVKELSSILDNVSGIHKKWLQEDINWIKTTPDVYDILPEKIDLCIFDGGEFSGELEFNKLWKRCKYIILDDTNKSVSIKHYKSREFILEHSEIFNVMIDDQLDRNGFLICEVK